MVSVLAASAERRGERVKGKNGVAEGGWWARSRPTVLHDSAAARALTTTSTEGLGPACLPDAERSANGKSVFILFSSPSPLCLLFSSHFFFLPDNTSSDAFRHLSDAFRRFSDASDSVG